MAGETEVLGENLPQCNFVHHKPHMLPGREPQPPRWEASDKPPELRHGRLLYVRYVSIFSTDNLTYFEGYQTLPQKIFDTET
jgi:hypothetical protein